MAPFNYLKFLKKKRNLSINLLAGACYPTPPVSDFVFFHKLRIHSLCCFSQSRITTFIDRGYIWWFYRIVDTSLPQEKVDISIAIQLGIWGVSHWRAKLKSARKSRRWQLLDKQPESMNHADTSHVPTINHLSTLSAIKKMCKSKVR